jgi:hypothetical protein
VPWIQVGGYRFDLDRVDLAYRQPGAEPSVMITLISGAIVNLSGEDAVHFIREFDAYRATRDIKRGPPDSDSGEAPFGPDVPIYLPKRFEPGRESEAGEANPEGEGQEDDGSSLGGFSAATPVGPQVNFRGRSPVE